MGQEVPHPCLSLERQLNLSHFPVFLQKICAQDFCECGVYESPSWQVGCTERDIWRFICTRCKWASAIVFNKSFVFNNNWVDIFSASVAHKVLLARAYFVWHILCTFNIFFTQIVCRVSYYREIGELPKIHLRIHFQNICHVSWKKPYLGYLGSPNIEIGVITFVLWMTVAEF